jgi:hypothetical protein
MSQVDSADPKQHTSEAPIWKIRAIKNYSDAHNHILVGRVLEITDSYV